MFLVLTVALVGATAYGLAHLPAPVEFVIRPPLPTPFPTPTSAAKPITCHIVGAVALPGVYTLPPHAVLQDAIRAAGGPTTNADLEQLNLSAVIQDHQQIVIPRRSTSTSPSTRGKETVTDGGLVNVNTADSETLQTLPSIGPVLASRIIDYRIQHGPFTAIDDLVKVKGIGEATLKKLRPLISLGP